MYIFVSSNKSEMVQQRFVTNPSEKSDNNQSDNKILSSLKSFGTRLRTRKTITQLQSEATCYNELKRTLSSFHLLALGIGGMIGKLNKYKRFIKLQFILKRYWDIRLKW